MNSCDNFDYEKAVKWLKKREATEKEYNHSLFERAEADCRRIIEIIRSKYDPIRIYQWGSLLHPEQFDANSDIDIAVEGLDTAEKFFSLYGEAMAVTEFPLDLVEMEKLDAIDRDTIRNKGKLIYERKDQNC